MKVDNFLRPFHGKATESWDQFWAKYLVMAEIQRWDDEPKRMKNFPLFLDGDAFLLYQGLAAADRKKQDEVTKLMKTSFNMTETNQAFVTRRLKSDESVDAFVADLKRLSALSGHAVADDKDSVVIQ